MMSQLHRQLEAHGYQGRVVSIQRLRDLQEEIAGHHEQGRFDRDFYQERLAVFTFRPPDHLPDARSLIVVAVPEPQLRVTFTWGGSPRPVIVPPTFYPERQVDGQVTALLAEVLGPAGYRVVPAVLPKKMLAAHTGLGAYGRNNLCYVPGMGSFHRLVALCSDFSCSGDNWQEPQMMDSCEKCVACLRHCPTGAITAGRFLLRAERCLTFHNERPGDMAFPAWIDRSWHRCLVGCMRCQLICPQNRDFVEWIEDGPVFSQEETAVLLAGLPLDQLPPPLVGKLTHFDMLGLLEVLPRNLALLLDRSIEH
jgi:epoxyqueuosine reductase